LLVPIEDFPRYPLTFGPSPIHPLDRLTEHLGGAEIWAKREDVNSGLAYGGNKTSTAALIGLGRELRDDEITVLDGWAGDFYGIPVRSTVDAITLTGRLEGMIIDPVYEGKSMAGLIDLVRSGDIDKDSTVLYVHLGGQPALNAYSGIFDGSFDGTRQRRLSGNVD